MSEPLVLSNVRVVRGKNVVVDDVSFVARKGRVLSLLGPNGAGKSSLVKAIAGILPYQGDIRIEGIAVDQMPRADRARKVGYVPQQSDLQSALLVHEVVAQGRYAHYVGRIRASDSERTVIDRALVMAEATSLAERDFTTLSQGEKQRVLIARALATEARVLLLDEPTSALDVGHALRLYQLLRSLAKDGYCIIAVLHALEDALDWTDDAIVLDRGRCVASGPTREVICAGPLEQVYGVRFVTGGALGFRLPEDRIEETGQ